MNDLETTIREQRKRLKRYDNIDGTGEMLFGCMMLGLLLAVVLRWQFPPNSYWTGFPGTLLALLVPAYGVLGLARWGVKTIKNRITYRRTGYVLPRRDKKAVALGLVYALVLSAAVSAVVFLLLRFGMRHNAVNLPRLLIMISYVAAYVFYAKMTTPEHKWKMWFAALMALVAVAASFSGWTTEVLFLVTLPVFGVIGIVSGLITLWLFVRHTQPAAQDDE